MRRHRFHYCPSDAQPTFKEHVLRDITCPPLSKRPALVAESAEKHAYQTSPNNDQRTYLNPDEQLKLTTTVTRNGQIKQQGKLLTRNDYKFVLTDLQHIDIPGIFLLASLDRLPQFLGKNKHEIQQNWEKEYHSIFPGTHDDLAANDQVYTAGILSIGLNNQLKKISNNSGHFKPTLESLIFLLRLLKATLDPKTFAQLEVEDHARVGEGKIVVYWAEHVLDSIDESPDNMYEYLDRTDNIIRCYNQVSTREFALDKTPKTSADGTEIKFIRPDTYIVCDNAEERRVHTEPTKQQKHFFGKRTAGTETYVLANSKTNGVSSNTSANRNSIFSNQTCIPSNRGCPPEGSAHATTLPVEKDLTLVFTQI